jgi:hypothetical protein
MEGIHLCFDGIIYRFGGADDISIKGTILLFLARIVYPVDTYLLPLTAYNSNHQFMNKPKPQQTRALPKQQNLVYLNQQVMSSKLLEYPIIHS